MAEDVKDKILNAAFEEFAVKGLAGARMQAIANRAGVNKALLNYYFTSKSQLYHDVVERKLAEQTETMEAALKGIANAREFIRMFVIVHSRLLENNPQLVKLIMRSYVDNDVVKKPIFNRHELPGKLIKRIQEFINRGEIRNRDPFQIVAHIMSLSVQAHLFMAMHKRFCSKEPVEMLYQNRINAILDLFENGLFTPVKN